MFVKFGNIYISFVKTIFCEMNRTQYTSFTWHPIFAPYSLNPTVPYLNIFGKSAKMTVKSQVSVALLTSVLTGES
jgi:hypothetical protein